MKAGGVKFRVFCLAVFSGLSVGCSATTELAPAQSEPLAIDAINTEMREETLAVGNRVPAGVVRYCWEEPMVEFEPNGPGVDAGGKWYNPYYLAVREVRMGKWRPCKPVSENRTSDHEQSRSN